MKAFFTTAKSVVEQAMKSEAAHHEDGLFNINISQIGKYVVVEGSAQTVMFLIGEVAGYGEDGLVRVEA